MPSNKHDCDDNDDASQIRQFKLKGHKASVLCLAHSNNISSNTSSAAPSCLLSGDEAGTARLWDLRSGGLRADLCLLVPQGGPQEVTSVAFAPPSSSSNAATTTSSNNNASAASNDSCSRDMTVYLSVGEYVYGYDLRHATVPIVREYTYDLSPVLEHSDEVNQISFSLAGRGRNNRHGVHLAAADDGGTVRVTDSFVPTPLGSTSTTPSPNRRHRSFPARVLYHDSDELAMVTSAVFRPRSLKTLDLASGGTDCMVHLWDVTRPRRPSSSHKILPLNDSDAGSAGPMCNPPMVHSLSWSPSGRLLAAGLGDGTCSLLRMDGRALVEVDRLRDGHDAAVASVVFPGFNLTSSSNNNNNHNNNNSNCQSHHVAAHDRLLISAGNDGAIFVWDLGLNTAGEGALDVEDFFHKGVIVEPSIEKKDEEDSLQDCDMQGLTIASSGNGDGDGASKLLFGIPHQQKPNYLVSSGTDQVVSSTIFVADTTNDITAYTLPLR